MKARKKFYVSFKRGAQVRGWNQFAKDRDEATRIARDTLAPGEILLSVAEVTK